MLHSPGLNKIYSPQLEAWLRIAADGEQIHWTPHNQKWSPERNPQCESLSFVAISGRLEPK